MGINKLNTTYQEVCAKSCKEHMSDGDLRQVRTFGRKKNATAVALVQGVDKGTDGRKGGQGVIRVNGKPLQLIEPESMRMKVYEPIFIVVLTDSRILASELELRAVVQWPRSWLSEWQLPRELLLTIKSIRMSRAKERLKTCLFNTIRDSSFRIPEDASQRSSVVQVPEQDSRNLIDELESSSCKYMLGYAIMLIFAQ